MGATRPVTDETFEAEVLRSTRTVLVDYWAERCGLSKMIAPILEAIGEEHGDKLGIASSTSTRTARSRRSTTS